ncbi:MAG: hypothetical protein RI969_1718 [Verrucomicrobiota bacterium]|jgi:hypothetical protein
MVIRRRAGRAPLPAPRHPPPGAATCHPERYIRSKGNRRPGRMPRSSCTPAHHPVPPCCPFACCIDLFHQPNRASGPLVLPPLPTGQRINSLVSFCSTKPLSLRASHVSPVSPCHRAGMSPRVNACPLVTVPTCPLSRIARHKKTRHSRDGSIGSGRPGPEGKAD